jgi:hypothetical protein
MKFLRYIEKLFDPFRVVVGGSLGPRVSLRSLGAIIVKPLRGFPFDFAQGIIWSLAVPAFIVKPPHQWIYLSKIRKGVRRIGAGHALRVVMPSLAGRAFTVGPFGCVWCYPVACAPGFF